MQYKAIQGTDMEIEVYYIGEIFCNFLSNTESVPYLCHIVPARLLVEAQEMSKSLNLA